VQCPNCGGESQVSETRKAGKHAVRRRRICQSCNQRFTTLEQIAPPQLKVEKRRGGTEGYQRAKLRRCVERIARHRAVDEETVEGIVEHIEARLVTTRTVRWGHLVELLLDALDGIDQVAAQRLRVNYLDDDGVLRLEDAPAPPAPQLGLFSADE